MHGGPSEPNRRDEPCKPRRCYAGAGPSRRGPPRRFREWWLGDPNSDEIIGSVLGERMARGGGLLFGRRTYEDLLSHWNRLPDSPFTPALNNAPKYVASNTLTEPLPWPNSTLLQGDVATAVAALKTRSDGDLGVMGSGELIKSLLPHHLIDEWLLMIHPLVLGRGRRLFPEGSPLTTVRLVDTLTTTTGVVIATYHAGEPTAVRNS